MEFITVAKPYANAIFEIAEQNKSHSDWRDVLDAGAHLANDEDLQGFIASPSVTSGNKAVAVRALFKSILARELSAEELAFINLVLSNARLGALPTILSLFDKSTDLIGSAKVFQVTSAYKLSAKAKKKIVSDLSDKYKTSVSIDTEVDGNLVGGLIIKDGDKVIDLSIQARVDGLNLCLSIN